MSVWSVVVISINFYVSTSLTSLNMPSLLFSFLLVCNFKFANTFRFVYKLHVIQVFWWVLLLSDILCTESLQCLYVDCQLCISFVLPGFYILATVLHLTVLMQRHNNTSRKIDNSLLFRTGTSYEPETAPVNPKQCCVDAKYW